MAPPTRGAKRPPEGKRLVGLWLLAVLVAEIPILLSGMRDPALLWVGGVVVFAPVLAQARNILTPSPDLRWSLILASAVLIVSGCILASQMPKLALETNLDVTGTGSFEEVRVTLGEHGVNLIDNLGMTREEAADVGSVPAVCGRKP